MNKLIENNQDNVSETFKTLQMLKKWQRRKGIRRRRRRRRRRRKEKYEEEEK